MAENQNKNNKNVQLDLNNEVFQHGWFRLEKDEQQRVLDTLKKVSQLTWDQVYRDQGLKWEKIVSVPQRGPHALYSLRITRSRRATAFRQDNFMRFLSVEPDHDSTYGKK
jgi:hypothetical protein